MSSGRISNSRCSRISPVSSPSSMTHRGVACHLLALCNGPLDRRGPAIFRQQRGVQIDVPLLRQVEHPARNDAPIANDHNAFRCNRLQLRAELRIVLDLLRLRDGQPKFDGLLLYRRIEPAPSRAPSGDPVASLPATPHDRRAPAAPAKERQTWEYRNRQASQIDCSGWRRVASVSCRRQGRRYMDFGTHRRCVKTFYHSPSRFSRLILRFIMSRLSPERWWM